MALYVPLARESDACHSVVLLPGSDTPAQNCPGSTPDSKFSNRPNAMPTVTVKSNDPEAPPPSVQFTVKTMSCGRVAMLPMSYENACAMAAVPPGPIAA